MNTVSTVSTVSAMGAMGAMPVMQAQGHETVEAGSAPGSAEEIVAAQHDAIESTGPLAGYNFAYLDEATKRMIRRAILKAVALPGHQVPFGSREMPLPFGWGTGGIQVTSAIIGSDDTLKVIDQGSDETTNAVNIRGFFHKVTAVKTTSSTKEATIIQTRHRVPETPLHESQIMVFQVPQPEALYRLEPNRAEARKLHAMGDYGLMHVKLYEDITRYGNIAHSYDYPVLVNGRYLMSPSPIPKFDNPKLNRSKALMLFGAGREKRIYAVPPYTEVKSLDFEDYPFGIEHWPQHCSLCGAQDSFLDEVIVDDAGTREYVCSDSDYCSVRREVQESSGEATQQQAQQEAQGGEPKPAKEGTSA